MPNSGSPFPTPTIDVAQVAARAAGRVFAELGLESGSPAVHGVHVQLRRAPAGPHGGAARSGRELIDAAAVARAAGAGVLAVPDDAVVTPLAEEEADRRGVRLVRGTGVPRRRLAVGSDHGGFRLKAAVLEWLRELGHVALDMGTRDEQPCDYPDFARSVAELVARGQCELGILIDGAGIGSAIAANKVPGVRAAACPTVDLAHNAREHNFANVLCLGAKGLEPAAAQEIVRTFLATSTGEERHARRVAKIGAIERHYARGAGEERGWAARP